MRRAEPAINLINFLRCGNSEGRPRWAVNAEFGYAGSIPARSIPIYRPRKAREDVLGLARDMYGLMMCVEKINTDEFMEYYAERMKGLKEQYESLRAQQEPKEQPR